MAEEKKIALKPCPFCLHDLCEVTMWDIDEVIYPSDNGYAVYCIICFSCGPKSKTVEGAINTWNKRPLENYLITSIKENK